MLTNRLLGSAAEVSLETTVRAVYMLEQAIVAWQKSQGNK